MLPRSTSRCDTVLFDGTAQGIAGSAIRNCEARSSGDRKYYITNHPPNTPRRTLVREIKARLVCEQAHQQLKDKLGLDHYGARSWLGLHHHALLTTMTFTYVQHRRLASHLQAGKRQPMHRGRHRNRNCRQYAAPLSPRCDTLLPPCALNAATQHTYVRVKDMAE